LSKWLDKNAPKCTMVHMRATNSETWKFPAFEVLVILMACGGYMYPSGFHEPRGMSDNSPVIQGSDGTSYETALDVNRRASGDPFMIPYEEEWLVRFNAR